jgi:hypothetical protein
MSDQKLNYNPVTLSIQPNQISTYIPSSGRGSSEKLVHSYLQNFEKERESNLMSIGSSKKLKKAINWMAYLSRDKKVFVKEINKRVKFQLSFITLTLPSTQIHTDQEIKKAALVPFLQWLRDRYNVKKYVWKAEIQKNGNIHFHITMDKFIHYSTLRNQWIRNINSLGYVDRYREESGKHTPPCTEIKAVKKVKNIAAYLAAYMSENVNSKNKKAAAEYNSRVIGGRLWGVSSYLMKLKGLRIDESMKDFSVIMNFVRDNARSSFHNDFVHSYFVDSKLVDELIEVFTEFNGAAWLLAAGLGEDDIALLTA